VVIRKDYRGKGLGRKIMEETEDHARRYSCVYHIFIIQVVVIIS